MGGLYGCLLASSPELAWAGLAAPMLAPHVPWFMLYCAQQSFSYCNYPGVSVLCTVHITSGRKKERLGRTQDSLLIRLWWLTLIISQLVRDLKSSRRYISRLASENNSREAELKWGRPTLECRLHHAMMGWGTALTKHENVSSTLTSLLPDYGHNETSCLGAAALLPAMMVCTIKPQPN